MRQHEDRRLPDWWSSSTTHPIAFPRNMPPEHSRIKLRCDTESLKRKLIIDWGRVTKVIRSESLCKEKTDDRSKQFKEKKN